MASISTNSKGFRRIQFMAGKRRLTIYLGACTMKDAQTAKHYIEELIATGGVNGTTSAKAKAWLVGISPELREKLAEHGLTAAMDATAAPLKETLDGLLSGRADLKPTSITVYTQVIRDLASFFGKGRDCRRIGPGDAEEFKAHLIGREQLKRRKDSKEPTKRLAATTIHKRLKAARKLFADLLRRRIIDANPFAEVRHAAAGGQDRQAFITPDDIEKVIKACPNHDWKCIAALARWGGLRTPSETLSIKWQDVDWEKNRISIPSPKTEGIGKPFRIAPLFPELKKVLLDAFEAAEEFAEYVLGDKTYREAGAEGWGGANLRTTFLKIIRRAKLTPWPRLFHNLRSSRETELVERYPIQTVAAWLGNTPTVAMKHYLQVTDAHFETAATEETPRQILATPTTQKTTQSMPETGGNPQKSIISKNKKSPELPSFSEDFRNLQNLASGAGGSRTPVPK